MARKRTPGNYALRKNGLVTFEDLTNCFTFFSLMLSTFDELVVWLRHNKLLKPKRFFYVRLVAPSAKNTIDKEMSTAFQ